MTSMPHRVAEDDGLPALADLPAYVGHYARRSPDRLVMSADDQSLTYGAVGERLAQYSAALRQLGLGGGSVVAVFGNPRPECLLVFLACCRTGAVFLGLNPRYTSRELALVCEDARPRALFAMTDSHDAEQVAKVKALFGAVSSFQHLVLRTPLSGISGVMLDDLTAASDAEAGPDPNPTSPCALVYTSGSTGSPKGALLSQTGLLRSAMLSWKYWYGALHEIRAVVQHPINHVAWLTCECLTPMAAGGTLFFRERFDGAGTLDLIEKQRLNLWFTFPSMVAIAMKSPAFSTADISSLKRIAFGSSPSLEIMKALRLRTEAVLSTSYGLTEASGGALTATSEGDPFDLVASSVGRVVPGVEVRMVDNEGRDASAGEIGELLVRDPCVFPGYLNRAADTEVSLDQDGWLHTGDVVTRDASGVVRLIGRKREMFKSGGYNVYPGEVEQVLSEFPGVAAAAVVDVLDPLWGEVGVGFVVTPDAAGLDLRALEVFLRQRLANYKIPKRFEFRSALPQLENGKVNKKALREEATCAMTVTTSTDREAP
jgi:acyl-CoA synthetase (AMP-forming)/AMP-acid ligase II